MRVHTFGIRMKGRRRRSGSRISTPSNLTRRLFCVLVGGGSPTPVTPKPTPLPTNPPTNPPTMKPTNPPSKPPTSPPVQVSVLRYLPLCSPFSHLSIVTSTKTSSSITVDPMHRLPSTMSIQSIAVLQWTLQQRQVQVMGCFWLIN